MQALNDKLALTNRLSACIAGEYIRIISETDEMRLATSLIDSVTKASSHCEIEKAECLKIVPIFSRIIRRVRGA